MCYVLLCNGAAEVSPPVLGLAHFPVSQRGVNLQLQSAPVCVLLSSLFCFNPLPWGHPSSSGCGGLKGAFGEHVKLCGRLQGGRKDFSWESFVAFSRVWEAGKVLQTQEGSRFWQGRACLSWSRSQRSYQVTCLVTVWNTSMCRFRSALALSSPAERLFCFLTLNALTSLVCCGVWASLDNRQTSY